MEVDPKVGIIDVYTGPQPGFVPELIRNGVFGFQPRIMGMPENRGVDRGVDRKSFTRVDPFRPVDGADSVIQFQIGMGFEIEKGRQKPEGGSTAVIGVVKQFFIAGKSDQPGFGFHLGGAQRFQFAGQQIFQSGKSLG